MSLRGHTCHGTHAEAHANRVLSTVSSLRMAPRANYGGDRGWPISVGGELGLLTVRERGGGGGMH